MKLGQQEPKPGVPPEEDDDDPQGDVDDSGAGDDGSGAGDEDEYDDYDPDGDEGESDPADAPQRPARRRPATVPPNQASVPPSRAAVPQGNNMDETQLDGDAVLKAIQEGTADGVERVLLSHLEPIVKALTAVNSSQADIIGVLNATGEGYATLVAENDLLKKAIGELHEGITLLKSVNVNLEKALGGASAGGETKPTAGIKPSDILIKAGVAVPGEGEGGDQSDAADANGALLTKALKLQAFGKTPDGLIPILQKAGVGQKPTEDDFRALRKGVEAVK